MDRRLSKRLQKAKRNPRSLRSDELVRLYEEHGFKVRQGKGSHYVASKGPIVRTFKRSNPVLPVYVREALAAIEESLSNSED